MLLFTDNFYLRGVKLEDARKSYEWAQDASLSKYMDCFPINKYEDMEKLCINLVQSNDNFAIAPEFENPVGFVLLKPTEKEYVAEIEYVVSRAYIKDEHVKDALNAVIIHGFTTRDYETITFRVKEENAFTRNILEEMGFRVEQESSDNKTIVTYEIDKNEYRCWTYNRFEIGQQLLVSLEYEHYINHFIVIQRPEEISNTKFEKLLVYGYVDAHNKRSFRVIAYAEQDGPNFTFPVECNKPIKLPYNTVKDCVVHQIEDKELFKLYRDKIYNIDSQRLQRASITLKMSDPSGKCQTCGKNGTFLDKGMCFSCYKKFLATS